MKKRTGIWIDKKKAYLIHLDQQGAATTKVIESGIEDFHPVGGDRSKTVYGPVITVKEKSFLEREKHQTKDFFKSILAALEPNTELYLFGPAQMKNKLDKFFRALTTPAPKVLAVETEDSITTNQMAAQVKEFFQNHPSASKN